MVVLKSFWLKVYFLKDIMNVQVNKKKSRNKDKCHSICTSIWSFWSVSILSRRCWLKFHTWLLMSLMREDVWFPKVIINNWDPAKDKPLLVSKYYSELLNCVFLSLLFQTLRFGPNRASFFDIFENINLDKTGIFKQRL